MEGAFLFLEGNRGQRMNERVRFDGRDNLELLELLDVLETLESIPPL